MVLDVVLNVVPEFILDVILLVVFDIIHDVAVILFVVNKYWSDDIITPTTKQAGAELCQAQFSSKLAS